MTQKHARSLLNTGCSSLYHIRFCCLEAWKKTNNQKKQQQHIAAAMRSSCLCQLTTCLLCAEARARPSSVQLRVTFISSTSSLRIFSFWASCWLLRRERRADKWTHRRGAVRRAEVGCGRGWGSRLHPGLVAELLVLLGQLLVAVLHPFHHLLQLAHLLLELLVAHLKVGDAVHQLRRLTGGEENAGGRHWTIFQSRLHLRRTFKCCRRH